MTSRSRPRAILNETQAIDIFHIKLAANASMQARPSPVQVAFLFGISEKAVRDIWKGRTWAKETHHLDPTRQVPMQKRCDRPRGSKGSMPRKISRHWNLGIEHNPMIPILETDITSIDACAAISSSQQHCDGDVKQRRNSISISGSIDRQLHEWTEGKSKPLKLVDPFRLDWVDWASATG